MKVERQIFKDIFFHSLDYKENMSMSEFPLGKKVDQEVEQF